MYRRLFSLPADGDNQGAVDTALHALLDEWLASEKAVLRSSAAAKASSSSLSSSLKGTASAGVDASASGSGATGDMNDDDDAIERRPICGHVFRKGETIYRCRTCGLDDTCVMCAQCYNNTTHTDHDVTFFLSSGGGGCCDCGDVEAWKQGLQCPFHFGNDQQMGEAACEAAAAAGGSSSSTSVVADDAISAVAMDESLASVRTVLGELLDFVLVTFGYWYAYPEDPMSMTQSHNLPSLSTLQEMFGLIDEPYAAMLWNDETHSFQDVIEQVREATDCSEEYAIGMAEAVDQCGRATVLADNSLPMIRSVVDTLRAIQLAAHVYPARYVKLEIVCQIVIAWLRTTIGRVPKLRVVLAHLLMERVDVESVMRRGEEVAEQRVNASNTGASASASNTEDTHEPSFDRQRKCAFRKHFHSFIETEFPKLDRPPSRIELLLFYDLRLWKQVRLLLREVYIAALMSDAAMRREFALRYAAIYEYVSRNFMTKEREPDLNIVFFSVQLFTTPSIATLLVQQRDMLSTLLRTLWSYMTMPEESSSTTLSPLCEVPSDFRLACDTAALADRRYFHFFQDLRYLLATEGVKRYLVGGLPAVGHFLEFCALFAEMDPNQRAVGVHVEYESTSWVNAFNVAYSLAQTISLFSEALAIDETGEACVKIAATAIARIQSRLQASPDFTIASLAHESSDMLGIRYCVAKQPVSFHSTINWLAGGALLRLYRLLSARKDYTAWDRVFSQSAAVSTLGPAEFASDPKTFAAMAAMELPLRVAVTVAQVRAGMWVRNGYGIRNQVFNYRGVSLRDDTSDVDFFLLQSCATVLTSDHFFAIILDRFDLRGFLTDVPKSEMELGLMVVLVEEFLAFLVQLLTDRSRLSLQTTAEMSRLEIIQVLSTGPKSYSEITRKISDTLIDNTPSFETILKAVATFKFPEGVSENGRYELRVEHFKDVLPCYPHFSRADREAVKQYRQKRQIAEDVLVHAGTAIAEIPAGSPFLALPRLYGSPMFAHIMFYVLHLATEDLGDGKVLLSSDYAIEQTLYLLQLGLCEGVSLENLAANMIDCNFARGDGKTSSTILGLLTHLLTKDTLKEYHLRINVVVELVAKVDERARPIIVASRQDLEQKREQDEAADKERRREEARERQRKIMQQFAAQQQSFADTHADLYDDVSSEEMEDEDEVMSDTAKGPREPEIAARLDVPTGTCILCQETLDRHTNKPYGLIGAMQASRLSREWRSGFDLVGDLMYWRHASASKQELEPHSPFAGRGGTSTAPDLPTSTASLSSDLAATASSPTTVASMAADSDDLQFLCEVPLMDHARTMLPGYFTSTCGHLIHYHCFDQYYETVRRQRRFSYGFSPDECVDFSCPLCKAFSNVLIPVVTDLAKEPRLQLTSQRHPSTFSNYHDWLVSGVAPLLGELEHRFEQLGLAEQQPDVGIFQFERCLAKNKAIITDTAMRLICKVVESDRIKFEQVDWLGYETFMDAFHRLPPLDEETGVRWEDLNAVVDEYFQDAVPVRSRVSDHPAKLASLHQFQGMYAPWRSLAYTIACHEISERPLCAARRPPIFAVDSMGRQSVFALSTQGTMQLQALVRMQLSTIATPDNHVAISTATLLMQHLFTTNHGLVTFPLLASDPFEIATALFTDPILSETDACGMSARRYILRWLLTLELVRAVLVLFGPWSYRHTLTELMEMAQDEVPCEFPAMNWNNCDGAQFAGDPIKRLIFAVRCWQTEGIVSAPIDRVAAKDLEEQIGLPPDEDLRLYYQVDFAFFAWLLDKCPSAKLLELLSVFATPFLRRCLILLHGALAEPHSNEDLPTVKMDGEPATVADVRRLCSLIELSLDEIIAEATLDPATSGRIEHECGYFGRFFSNVRDRRLYFAYSYAHFAKEQGDMEVETDLLATFVGAYQQHLCIAHPLPYNLEHLPETMESLLLKTNAMMCLSCKNHPPDPALCMLCGAILCAHSYCCAKEGKGECSRHAEWHQDVGMFFLLKKCTILLLRNGQGCIKNAPYVDVHGETDLGLRRGKPQFLFPLRLNEYRKMYLKHQIASTIARSLENAAHPTIWESF